MPSGQVFYKTDFDVVFFVSPAISKGDVIIDKANLIAYMKSMGMAIHSSPIVVMTSVLQIQGLIYYHKKFQWYLGQFLWVRIPEG